MTPAELADGARLLAARQADPRGSEGWAALMDWLEDHAAELIADAGRLEWFATHLLRPDSSMRFPDGTFKSVNAWSIASHNTDLRAAIDAARTSGEPCS